MVNIKGLDKGAVLAALYNNSRQQGMGFLDMSGQGTMTPEQANELLKKQTYFDYLRGRVMKVRILPDADELENYLYDRDNGKGAMQDVIDELRASS